MPNQHWLICQYLGFLSPKASGARVEVHTFSDSGNTQTNPSLIDHCTFVASSDLLHRAILLKCAGFAMPVETDLAQDFHNRFTNLSFFMPDISLLLSEDN